ncbi:MAG: cupin-like domain-containing protein [Pseudoxanthomonas sp.]
MPITITELQADLATFALDEVLGRSEPAVLRGLCRDWPLVRAARRSDSEFAGMLAALDSGAPVDTLVMPPEAGGLVGYSAGMERFNYRHFRVPITEVLQRLAKYSRIADQPVPGVAMQSALVADCLPGLLQTHSLPFLDAGVQPRIWIGNKVTTPTHFDGSHNIAVVACGRRRFTLFPIEQVANLYIGPLDFAPTAAAVSMARLDEPDFERFPKLEEALRHARVAELEPGDALYMPPLWWHHVESLERLNALVNYWWRNPAPGNGLSALAHCLLAFKSLPRGERDAWKTLLQHYVFGDDDIASHIPPERRGLLGEPDAAAMDRMKAIARNGLD